MGKQTIAYDGHARFWNSQITNLGKLEHIGGYANFQRSKIKDLGNLEHIGGHAVFWNSKITNLGKLKYIGGLVYIFEGIEIEVGGKITSEKREEINKLLKKYNS